jgi:ADP-heptose:LPS heptosyltransferase
MIPLRLQKYFLTYGAAPINRFRRRAPSNVLSVFIVKFDGLGDFILLLPLLKRLFDSGFRPTVAGHPFQSEILKYCGLDIAAIPIDTSSPQSVMSALSAVKKLAPAFAVNLSMNAWGGILVNQTRAHTMIGLLQEREWYVYKGSSLFYDGTISYDPTLHSFEVNHRLFQDLLGLQHVAPHFERLLRDNGEIVIHPYGSWRPRRWPYFPELIESLRNSGFRCAVLGTPAEHDTGGVTPRINDRTGVRIVTLTSIAHLLGEIEQCRAFVGNDSGPAHYAALIGKPSFVLWGPGNFERIRPVGKEVHIFKKEIDCRPCRQRGEQCTRGENECLKRITVEEVFSTLTRRIRH